MDFLNAHGMKSFEFPSFCETTTKITQKMVFITRENANCECSLLLWEDQTQNNECNNFSKYLRKFLQANFTFSSNNVTRLTFPI